jgi:hypothetical protein
MQTLTAHKLYRIGGKGKKGMDKRCCSKLRRRLARAEEKRRDEVVTRKRYWR